MEASKTIMLPHGLHLFIADVIDEETNEQTILYVVGKTHDSALNRFIKEANQTWNKYAYYFYEADEDEVERFIETNGRVGSGIYD